MKESTRTLTAAITDCITACNNCFDECLKSDDIQHMAGCIRSNRECVDICTLALSFLTREGSLKTDLLNLLSIAAQACGEECEKHDHDHCQASAKACFACVEACQNHPLMA